MTPEEKTKRINELISEIVELTLDRPVVIREGQPVCTDEDLDRRIVSEIRLKRAAAMALRGYPNLV